jgi:hypothetical protein
MPTTRAILTPLSAEFPASNNAALLTVNARPVLAFDATTSETVYWSLLVPQGVTGALSAVITYMMASATSGGVAFDVAVEAQAMCCFTAPSPAKRSTRVTRLRRSMPLQ